MKKVTDKYYRVDYLNTTQRLILFSIVAIFTLIILLGCQSFEERCEQAHKVNAQRYVVMHQNYIKSDTTLSDFTKGQELILLQTLLSNIYASQIEQSKLKESVTKLKKYISQDSELPNPVKKVYFYNLELWEKLLDNDLFDVEDQLIPSSLGTLKENLTEFIKWRTSLNADNVDEKVKADKALEVFSNEIPALLKALESDSLDWKVIIKKIYKIGKDLFNKTKPITGAVL